MKRLAVIIPTYNEEENILRLIKEIDKVAKGSTVIVVDDNSPDHTASLVRNVVKNYPHLKLISRKGKLGRGSAVLTGMKEAIKDKKIEYFVEMDADFSHDPHELFHLTNAAQRHDMVIAARYVKGSRILNWPISRHIFSFFANKFAQTILKVPVKDYTNGFRCYTRSCLHALNLNNLCEPGYALLMEMLYEAHRKHLNIGQIPTVFVNRKRGKSNSNLREIMNALNAPVRILKRHAQ